MKKILMAIVLCLVCTITCCTKNEEKLQINELISLRNNYQDEYDLLENEWFLRNLKENGKYCDKQYNSLYSTYEEFQRHKTLKDSIEILNIMINNYQF